MLMTDDDCNQSWTLEEGNSLSVSNSLLFSVITAPSVNSFKNRLDKFKNRLDKHWASQELRYNWEAELSGTGRRSRFEF